MTTKFSSGTLLSVAIPFRIIWTLVIVYAAGIGHAADLPSKAAIAKDRDVELFRVDVGEGTPQFQLVVPGGRFPLICDDADQQMENLRAIGFSEAEIDQLEEVNEADIPEPKLAPLGCSSERTKLFAIEEDGSGDQTPAAFLQPDGTGKIYRAGCVGVLAAAGVSVEEAETVSKSVFVFMKNSISEIPLRCRDGEIPVLRDDKPIIELFPSIETHEVKIGSDFKVEVSASVNKGPVSRGRLNIVFESGGCAQWMDQEGTETSITLSGSPGNPDSCQIRVEVSNDAGEINQTRNFSVEVRQLHSETLVWTDPPKHRADTIKAVPLSSGDRRIKPIPISVTTNPDLVIPAIEISVELSSNCLWLELEERVPNALANRNSRTRHFALAGIAPETQLNFFGNTVSGCEVTMIAKGLQPGTNNDLAVNTFELFLNTEELTRLENRELISLVPKEIQEKTDPQDLDALSRCFPAVMKQFLGSNQSSANNDLRICGVIEPIFQVDWTAPPELESFLGMSGGEIIERFGETRNLIENAIR